jgi:membrane-bound metal-dependent hydrolase YbcI (DUF457 family)
MFIGHYALGFGAKKAVPRVSLGTLFLSVQFLDMIWPLFLILGWEHVRIDPGNTSFTPMDLHDYPFSHSLVMAFVWSVGFGMVYYIARRYVRGALILGIGVMSHWVLDFFTHRPDLPIYPGSATYVGLGLWNSFFGTMAVESLIFLIGVTIYARTTKEIDRIGRLAFWILVIFLAVAYLAAAFGPPPPSETAIAWGSLSIWLLVPWGYWIDRHRQPV